jgi:hypothetical protein
MEPNRIARMIPGAGWFAGDKTGRGHGPGGRLFPQRGDRLEIQRPLCNPPVPWDIVEVLQAREADYFVLLGGPGYVVPRKLDCFARWRWPQKATDDPQAGGVK